MTVWSVLIIIAAITNFGAGTHAIDDSAVVSSPFSFSEEPNEINKDHHTSKEKLLQKLFLAFKHSRDGERRDFLNIVLKQSNRKKGASDYVEVNGNRYYHNVHFNIADNSAVVSITVHWEMEKNDYSDSWIGLFKLGASNDDSIAHARTSGAARGYIELHDINLGILKGDYRNDIYELRFFNENSPTSLAPSETNYLRLSFTSRPSYDNIGDGQSSEKENAFLSAIASAVQASEGHNDENEKPFHFWNDMQNLWLRFDMEEQALLRQALIALNEKEQQKLQVKRNKGPCDIIIKLQVKLLKAKIAFKPLLNVANVMKGTVPMVGIFATNCDFEDLAPFSKYDVIGSIENSHFPLVSAVKDGLVAITYKAAIINKETKEQIGFANDEIDVIVTATDFLQPASSPFSDPTQQRVNVDWNMAIFLGEMSSLSYKSYAEIKKNLGKYHLKPFYEISGSKDTHGYMAYNDSIIVIAFRGTNSLQNAKTDLNVLPRCIYPFMLVHGGFLAALNTVYSNVKEELQKIPNFNDKQLYITGHSLGGALASLLAFRLKLVHYIAHPTLYTYGCPPFAYSKYVSFVRDKFKTYNFALCCDPVALGSIADTLKTLQYHKSDVLLRLPMIWKNKCGSDIVTLLKGKHHCIINYIEQLRKRETGYCLPRITCIVTG